MLDAVAEQAADSGVTVAAGPASEYERATRHDAAARNAPVRLAPGRALAARGAGRRQRGRVACRVVLDDVRWADAGSLELLDHVLRHPLAADGLERTAADNAAASTGRSSITGASRQLSPIGGTGRRRRGNAAAARTDSPGDRPASIREMPGPG
ncbi:hypothetical protein GCM10010201_25210 [Pilimelia columellifera subsp. columellifera]|uniref:Uncharacterized protein n=1 Tax=Pilimelia columellifera subsp. columellifera TaxID=706583 RepID=A0ABN3NM39_9ACTN